MEKNTNRLHALDGLRGFAMMLVFLTHVNPQFIIQTFPFVDWIGIFSSGVLGVSFFFILSGFLMAYLYPSPPSNVLFIQKRYTRIFPLFLTMTAFMLFLRNVPNIPWFYAIALLLICMLTSHVVWVYGVKKIDKPIVSRTLLFAFIFLQVIVGGVYLFFVMPKSPIVFNQEWSVVAREGLIGLVNATLTFPLGNYVPMLDGVYWSLAAEILFYVLYPWLIAPIVFLLQKKNKIIISLFVVSLFPLFAGIDILSHHIWLLSSLQPSLFLYFATGIILACLYRINKNAFTPFSKILRNKFNFVTVLLLGILLILEHMVSSLFRGDNISLLTRILSAVPLTIFVAMVLDRNTMLSKILRSKIFVAIGTVSYSLYLTHAPLIHIAESVYIPNNIYNSIVFIILVFGANVLLAFLSYWLLEKPYFIRPKKQTAELTPASYTEKRVRMLLAGTIVVGLVGIFIAFQSNFNFFSKVVKQKEHVLIPENIQDSSLSLQQYQHISMQVDAKENNLGIVLLNLTYKGQEEKRIGSAMMIFSFREADSKKTIFTSSYVLDQFKGVDFPFGVPIIADSKGKSYLLDFSLTEKLVGESLDIDTASLKTVYQLNKTSLLKNPSELLLLFVSKVENIFTNPLSFAVLILFAPHIFISLFLLITPKNVRK